MKLEIIYKKINEIIPYKNNPRKNDDAVDDVANSIKEFGFTGLSGFCSAFSSSSN